MLAQVRLFNSGLYELKAQILQKRNPALPNQRREMFSEDDLVVITILNQPVKKLFGLIRSGERIIDKARLHKTYRELRFLFRIGLITAINPGFQMSILM